MCYMCVGPVFSGPFYWWLQVSAFFLMRKGSLFPEAIFLLAIHRKPNFFQDCFKLPANFVAGCPRMSLYFYCQPLISSPFALSASDASICNLTQRGQR